MTSPSLATPAAATRELADDVRTMIAHLRRTMRAQGEAGDFTQGQAGVLRRLESEGPATVTALAAAEGMRSQSMGTIIAGLEELGAVRREPDPADGRRSILSLEPSFRDRMLTSRAQRVDWLASKLDTELDAEQRAELARAVASLLRIAQS